MAALDSGTLDQVSTPTVFDVKDSVEVATTANITLSGEKTIDGVSTSKSRVLVKDQSDASKNGIYVTKSGSWSRAEDANSNDKINANMYMWVESGSTNGDNGFVLTTNDPIILDTTNLHMVINFNSPRYLFSVLFDNDLTYKGLAKRV